jgi:hypothetical protein
VVVVVLQGALLRSNVIVQCGSQLSMSEAKRCTHKFSDPVGTKTPSASRYDLKSSVRGIMLDFIDREENVGNQLEN